MAKTFDQVVDELLLYMSTASLRPQDGSRFHRLPLKHFSGAEPLIELDVVHSARHEGGRDRAFLLPGEVAPRDLWPIDLSVIVPTTGDAKFGVRRCRSVAPAEVRGRFRIRSPYLLEDAIAVVYESGEYESARCYCCEMRGDWYRVDGVATTEGPTLDRCQDAGIKIAHSVAFTRQYEWRVVIGFEGSPSISFSTDPVGAREVFRLRDIPEGRQRRAALRHWVSEHWRRKRVDPREEAKVRAHLRGATEFAWNGLQCSIQPSAYDLKRANQEVG